MQRATSTHFSGGFTLISMLVTVTIVALSLALGVPAFQNWIQRARVEGYGRHLAGLMHLARSRAILNGVEVVVVLDEDEGEVYAFIDRSGATPGSPGDRIFNPTVGAPPGTTDEKLATHSLPGGVGFLVPAPEDLVDGFTPVAGGHVAVFCLDGTLRDPGAFRFGDNWGNHLEVRVEPALTARVALRKYKKVAGGGNPWFTRAENGGPWEWYWGKGRQGGGG